MKIIKFKKMKLFKLKILILIIKLNNYKKN